MAPRLGAAVVGGGTGGRLSIEALRRSEHFELVAVCDLCPEVRQALQRDLPGVRIFPDVGALFAACPTDLVCVSTPPPSHEAVARAALERPLRAILVEKPLGETAASGRRILEAVRRRRLPLAVPHGLLARRATLDVLERVRGGEIGALRLVQGWWNGWDLINAGIHWLHYFDHLTGHDEIDSVLCAVDARSRTYRDGMQVETLATTSVWTRSGVRAVLETGDALPLAAEETEILVRAVGSEGYIEAYGWEPRYRLVNGRHPGGEVFAPPELPVSGHQRHLEGLLPLLESGDCDYGGAEASLRALEICEAAYLSARHRCLVRFPIEGFEPPPAPDWEPGRPYAGAGGGRDGRTLAGSR